MKKGEIAKLSYETAVSLWIHYSEEAWTRFSIMITSNSILLTASLLLFTNSKFENKGGLEFFTIIPLIICIIFNIFGYVLVHRSTEFCEYYI